MASREWTVEVVGSKAIGDALRQLGAQAPHALAGGMYQEAEGTMTLAKTLTPVDTGNLRASGHVALPTIDGPMVEVALGFGGPAGSGNHGGQSNEQTVGYAVYVHERVELRHPVGQAKFLEAAYQQRKLGMADRLAFSLQTALRGVKRGLAG